MYFKAEKNVLYACFLPDGQTVSQLQIFRIFSLRKSLKFTSILNACIMYQPENMDSIF